jgi:hypothetical protein
MAKDDYFVIQYRILKYLYVCLKEGVSPTPELLTAKHYNINGGYWWYIIGHLLDDELIEDIIEVSLDGGKIYTGMQDMKITPKGIAYLQENSLMQKAKKVAKGLIDVVT